MNTSQTRCVVVLHLHVSSALLTWGGWCVRAGWRSWAAARWSTILTRAWLPARHAHPLVSYELGPQLPVRSLHA